MNFHCLPTDILKLIYDYDPTFHSVFSSLKFKHDIEHRWLSKKEPIFYKLIRNLYYPLYSPIYPGVIWSMLDPSFIRYSVYLQEEFIVQYPPLMNLYQQAGFPRDRSIAFDGFICDSTLHHQFQEIQYHWNYHPLEEDTNTNTNYKGVDITQYTYGECFYPYISSSFHIWYKTG